MINIPFIDVSFPTVVMAPIFLVGWVIAGWILKKILFVWFQQLAKKTDTPLDDILLAAVNLPLLILIVGWGMAVTVRLFLPSLPPSWHHAVFLAMKGGTIGAGVLFFDRLLRDLVQVYSVKIEILRASQAFIPVIGRLLILSVGLLILLDSFGISITPIIASLGIGSLAVALALQPTFENIFSGFQIIIDQPIKPGDFIKLESGEEGFVDKIDWRSTWIRQLANNMIIIPNKQLVNTRLINYHYPSKELAILMAVGVHYSSDLEKVERVTLEVARDIQRRVSGGVSDFEPLIRFHTFNSSSIDFTVVLRAQQFTDGFLLKHEFIKALTKRYTQEDIVIPYPITAINTAQEKAFLK